MKHVLVKNSGRAGDTSTFNSITTNPNKRLKLILVTFERSLRSTPQCLWCCLQCHHLPYTKHTKRISGWIKLKQGKAKRGETYLISAGLGFNPKRAKGYACPAPIMGSEEAQPSLKPQIKSLPKRKEATQKKGYSLNHFPMP